jgi:hypothetical protein
MQQLTINIPDNKIDFFMELVQNLGFNVDKKVQGSVLTEEQIKMVNDERKKIKENPEHFIDWVDARKTLKLD